MVSLFRHNSFNNHKRKQIGLLLRRSDLHPFLWSYVIFTIWQISGNAPKVINKSINLVTCCTKTNVVWETYQLNCLFSPVHILLWNFNMLNYNLHCISCCTWYIVSRLGHLQALVSFSKRVSATQNLSDIIFIWHLMVTLILTTFVSIIETEYFPWIFSWN